MKHFIVYIFFLKVALASQIKFPVNAGNSVDLFGACKIDVVIDHPKVLKNLKGAVLFIQDKGPLDFDGNLQSGYHPYKDLSNFFLSKNFVTIRFSKRSTYQNCAAKLNSPKFTHDVFLKDAKFSFLQAIKKLPIISNLPLAILGHGQGGHFALKIAKDINADKLILISLNVKNTIDENLLNLLKENLKNPELIGKSRIDLEKVIKEGEDYFSTLKQNQLKNQKYFLGAYPLFWKSYIQLTKETISDIKKFAGSILYLQGKRDRSVSKSDFLEVQKILKSKSKNHAVFLDGIDAQLSESNSKSVSQKVFSQIENFLIKKINK